MIRVKVTLRCALSQIQSASSTSALFRRKFTKPNYFVFSFTFDYLFDRIFKINVLYLMNETEALIYENKFLLRA